MKLIEKFYNEKIFVEGMKKFDELQDWQKNNIRKCFSFETFKLKQGMKELKETTPVTFIVTWLFVAIISSALLTVFVIGLKTIFGW